MTKKSSDNEVEDSAIWSSLVGNIVAVIMSAYFWLLSNGNCPKKPPNSYDTKSLNNAINDLKKMAEEIHNSTSKPYNDIQSNIANCSCNNENVSKSPSENVSPAESDKELPDKPTLTKGCSCQTIENMGSFRAKYTTTAYPCVSSTKHQEYRPYHEPARTKKKTKSSKPKRTKIKPKKAAEIQDATCYIKCFSEQLENKAGNNCGNKSCPVYVHYHANIDQEDIIKKETVTPIYQKPPAKEDIHADTSETSSFNCDSSCSVLKSTKHPCAYYMNGCNNESTQATENVEESDDVKGFEQEESQTDPYSVTLRNYSQTEQEYDEQEEACTPCYTKRQCQENLPTPKAGPSHYSGNYIDQMQKAKPATIQYAPNYYTNQTTDTRQDYIPQSYTPVHSNMIYERGYRTLGVAPTPGNYMKRLATNEQYEQVKIARQRQLGVQKAGFPQDYYGSANARAVQPGAYMNLMTNSPPYSERNINQHILNRNEAYVENAVPYTFQRTNFTNKCPSTCPTRRPLCSDVRSTQQQAPLALMPNGAIPIRSSQNTLSMQNSPK